MARIGVNALYLIPGGVGGTEIYLSELLLALARIDRENQYVVFTNLETGTSILPSQPNFTACPQAFRARIRPLRLLWEQSILPFQAWRQGIDVLFNPGFTAPVFAPCPTVTVFHDLQHKRHPEYFKRLDLPFWRFFLWLSARYSSRLIAVSQATKSDLAHYYGAPGERARVIHHGVAEELFYLDRSEVKPYLLCVSTLHPHKNLERLIRVYATLQLPLQLVIVGMPGFHTAAIEDLILDLKISQDVHLSGWVPRTELYDLYAHAHSFIYPSTFEGFGLPILEALAAGIPTACSDIPPLREVADRAALFFDPRSDADIARALSALTGDEQRRHELTSAGPQRARLFSWDQTARLTLAAAQGLLHPTRGR